MSHGQSQTSTEDKSPLLLDSMLSSKLDLDCQADCSSSSTGVTVPQQPPRTPVILSTQSEVAWKLGTQQLIPKNLAVTSRPKNRHHTTVVTLPVVREAQKNIQRFSHDPSASWEEYDSDDGGLRRNRRNKSYRAAVTSLDADLSWKQDLLQPLSEEKEKTPSPKPVPSPGHKVSQTTISWFSHNVDEHLGPYSELSYVSIVKILVLCNIVLHFTANVFIPSTFSAFFFWKA